MVQRKNITVLCKMEKSETLVENARKRHYFFFCWTFLESYNLSLTSNISVKTQSISICWGCFGILRMHRFPEFVFRITFGGGFFPGKDAVCHHFIMVRKSLTILYKMPVRVSKIFDEGWGEHSKLGARLSGITEIRGK